MSAQSITVASVITRIRNQADIETNDQANSAFPDAILVDWLNQAYRAFYDLLIEDLNDQAEAYFATSASLGPSSWTLPSGCYRVLGVDYAPQGVTMNADYFAFRERNNDTPYVSANPRWRVQAGALLWRPNNPSAAVTLWYVPSPAALAADGSFDAFNGWDDFVTQWVVRQVKLKQEYDISEVMARMAEAARRVKAAAHRLMPDAPRIADVRCYADEAYYNS